ncbi:putative pentatricopeptide repeat-containing protein, chloroplastic-like [Capsicum annuum]|nr:putative pentatricopeptide repeat-containing protein, chloroplastic-like [Capsicum annuum]
MGNSLRCCLACVLPCGALDLIRIVHLNGHVEEITSPITAYEALKNYPNHVLSKPCSQGTMARRILILSPNSELKRGNIYFLIPASSVPSEKKKFGTDTSIKKSSKVGIKNISTNNKKCHVSILDDHDHDLTDSATPKLKKSTSHRRNTSGKVVVWRPHLESISEN